MLTRRGRDLPRQKTEPTPFAAKAKDLGALRDVVVDAATVGAGFWISYLFALFYFAIATGAVTHRDLLLEGTVKLPFLNVELPLKAFFILGPFVFLIVHAYVLLHFVFLAGKIGAFNSELQAQISNGNTRARLRWQLPSNIVVQSLAGPPDARTAPVRLILWLITRISLVFGPIALLILFQLQFLPYHSEWITWWQRITVVADLVLSWCLWPPIARGQASWLGWSDFGRVKVWALLLVSVLPVLLMFTIATFPGEWLEEKLPSVRLIPTTWQAWTLPSVQAIQAADSGWATLHELLVAGPVNYVTGRPQSLWSNVLVLPNFEGGERALQLRGRSLEGAVLVGAHLRNADFTGASLAGAKFALADLREARFGFEYKRGGHPGWYSIAYNKEIGCSEDIGCAQLQGADFSQAQLQGASLARAQLQGANFMVAHLEGAELISAQLQGATLMGAHLQGASLNLAQLQGVTMMGAQLQCANLDQAQLQGANLTRAQLQGASLNNTQLQGAFLARPPSQPLGDDARLDGASLGHTYLWRTYPPANPSGAFVSAPETGPKYVFLDCPAGECDWSEKSYAALKSLIEDSVPPWERHEALRNIATLEKPPYIADEDVAEAWTNLAKESVRSSDSYFSTLAEILKKVGCAAEGAPYVIRGLMRVTWGNPSQAAGIASTFLDETKCPGARGLTEGNKEKLREIRDRGLPAPAGPAAAAR